MTALAFMENYQRIRNLPQFRAPVGYQKPVYLRIYDKPIGPQCPRRIRFGRVLYAAPIGPQQPVIRDVLDIASPVQPSASVTLRRTKKEILDDVSQQYGVSIIDLKSDRRAASIVLPRQIAMYRMRMETHSSLPEIGRFMNRDHSTIISAIKKINKLKARGVNV